METKKNSSRSVVIATTAAPPWYTGTALNPLYRAQALERSGLNVTLIFPWIAPEQQKFIFEPGVIFENQQQHAQWIKQRFDLNNIKIKFYAARYLPRWRSIYPSGQLTTTFIPCDLLILEEPDHLLLFQPWFSLKRQMQFSKVVGIIHTNYMYYTQGLFKHFSIRWVHRLFGLYLRYLVSRNCHQVIRLSPAVEIYPQASTQNVHGVDDHFLRTPRPDSDGGIYFLGKLIWEKGWRELIDLLAFSAVSSIDVFGIGDSDSEQQITSYAAQQGVHLQRHGYSSEPWRDLAAYKIFINCSASEVLCTASAEALAMGKFVLLPRHPANEFFYTHPNCLVYEGSQQFKAHLHYALNNRPDTISDDRFSWDQATQRLLQLIDSFHFPINSAATARCRE